MTLRSGGHRTSWQAARHRLLGLALLGVMLGAVGLAVAFYDKAFTRSVTVELHTDDVGNNLPKFADVKLRGMVVGEVRKVSATGATATVELAIDPAKARYIPANSTAQLLPTSLFGQNYVALIPPPDPAAPIRSGDVIEQDRSTATIGVEQVLADTLPVLDALHPAQLSATLRSIADALDGHGAELGSDLVRLDQLLKQFNPHLPELLHAIVQTGAVSQDWSTIVPDLLGALNSANVTAVTISSHSAGLANLLTAVTGAGNQLTQFVNADGAGFDGMVAANRPALDLLARFAPEYVCTLRGLVSGSARLNSTVYDHQVHALAELVAAPPAYTTQLQYSAGGPSCSGLPGTAPASALAVPLARIGAVGPGSLAEAQAVSALIAGDLGTAPSRVPSVAALLAAPLLRGTAVAVK